MDLSVYISELLFDLGTVKVPGLGVFKRVNKHGYYDEQSGTFFPPHYQASFEQRDAFNDDVLTKYISHKNKVSVASSTYILEKYLAALLQQSDGGDSPLGQLGWIYKDRGQLKFRANPTGSASNSAIFGFAPVSLKKEAEAETTPVSFAEPEPVEVYERPAPPVYETPKFEPTPEPVAKPKVEEQPKAEDKTDYHEIVLPATPAAAVREPEPVQYTAPVYQSLEEEALSPDPVILNTNRIDPHDDEERGREPMNVWIVSLIAAAVIIIAIFAFYKYNQMSDDSAVTDQKTNSASMASARVDSVVVPNDEEQTVNDTSAVTVGTLSYNSAIHKFALIGGHYETVRMADDAIESFKKKGIPATLLAQVPQESIKVTLGYFSSFKEAQDAKTDLVKKKNLNSADLFVKQLKY